MYSYPQYFSPAPYSPMPYNPGMTAQERINNLQQHMSANQPPMQPMQPQGPVINARAVTGYEEAQAAQIPLDGSMNIFTDFGHKQIYVKQFDNTNGTANIHVFRLEEPVAQQSPAQAPAQESQPEYVLKSDFDALKRQFEELSGKLSETAEIKQEPKKGVKNNANA